MNVEKICTKVIGSILLVSQKIKLLWLMSVEKMCLNCREKGHVAWQCPKRNLFADTEDEVMPAWKEDMVMLLAATLDLWTLTIPKEQRRILPIHC
jgi:hypothetical protein